MSTTTIKQPPAATRAVGRPNISAAVDDIIPANPTDAASTRSRTIESFEVTDNGEAATEAEPVYPEGFKFYMIILSAGLVLIIAGMDGSMVSIAVPSITDEFHTVADIGWYSSAFRLALCSFQFMFGKLYKIFSVKMVFLASIVIFELGSLLCATAPTSTAFVIARAVCGLGMAGISAGCFTLLVQLIPLRKRPVYTGVLGSIEGLSGIVAPILGGVLCEKLSWRWCFWINLPLGGITILTIAIFLTNPVAPGGTSMSRREKLSQLDLLGNLIFVPSLTCLFLALQWAGSKYSWTNARIIGLLVVFVALLGLFVWQQYRKQDNATLPPRIVCQRSVIAGFIFSFCNAGAMTVIPTYFQAVKEYSPTKAGVMLLPTLIGFMVSIMIMGSGVSLIGYYVPFMLVASVISPIAVGLMTTWTLNSTYAQLICYQGLSGFASGIGWQAPQLAVQTSLPATDVPLGLAIVLFAQNFGPALFIAIGSAIFTNRLTANLHDYAPGLNVTSIENLGLSDIKDSIGPEKLGDVLLGFDKAVSQTWYLAVALTCMTIIGSATMEWRSVKQKKS